MKSTRELLLALSPDAMRRAHLAACRYSLTAWEAFCREGKGLSYTDSVVGMKHAVDRKLPLRAFKAVLEDSPNWKIGSDYSEPIVALQDFDWEPPRHIEYAFFSVFNLYKKYCEKESIDDWLIFNQAISSEVDDSRWDFIGRAVLRKSDSDERAASATTMRQFQVFYYFPQDGREVPSGDPVLMNVADIYSDLLGSLQRDEDFFGVIDASGATLQVVYKSELDKYWMEIPMPAESGSYGAHYTFDEITDVFKALPDTFPIEAFARLEFQSWG